jgi:hypothetical protein
MTAADQSDQTVKNRLPRGRPHMANAVEAVGQDVHQKAADDLGGVERHGPEPVAAFDAVVLPFEGDARVVEGDEPGIGDRDAMGVTREVGENGLGSGEGSLG